jgi:phosphate-selective porin OprO/OprP
VTTAGATEVVHLGAAIGVENVAKDRLGRPTWRVQSRPEADVTSTRLVDTGTFLDADKVNRWGVEGGWNSGPFNVMAEWQNFEVTRKVAADFKGTGGYVTASWFMTGESMTYRDGLFTPPLPNDPEKGAIQFTARWSTIDLNDGLVRGGSEDNFTVGVNYWWRSNYMVSLNYGLIDSERGAITNDEPRALTARVQLYW